MQSKICRFELCTCRIFLFYRVHLQLWNMIDKCFVVCFIDVLYEFWTNWSLSLLFFLRHNINYVISFKQNYALLDIFVSVTVLNIPKLILLWCVQWFSFASVFMRSSMAVGFEFTDLGLSAYKKIRKFNLRSQINASISLLTISDFYIKIKIVLWLFCFH